MADRKMNSYIIFKTLLHSLSVISVLSSVIPEKHPSTTFSDNTISSSIGIDSVPLSLDTLLTMVEESTPEPVTQLLHDEGGHCIFVKSEEGLYSYTSPGNPSSSAVCGLYVISEADQFVEFEFEDVSVHSCSSGGLLSVIDGWELNGQFFPGTKDHLLPKNRRYHEFCSTTRPIGSYKMSQNVGLIEFRLPFVGDSFKLRVRFRNNPKPCNVVLQKPQGVYTLRNYGERLNCSASIIFPESFRLLSSNIGIHHSSPAPLSLSSSPSSSPSLMSSSTAPDIHSSSKNLVETGITRQCRESGALDYVEIRGGDGLDPTEMFTADNYCGHDLMPGELDTIPSKSHETDSPIPIALHKIDVFCGNTAVRLVSSGKFENSVTVAFTILLDLKSPTLTCPSLLEGV